MRRPPPRNQRGHRRPMSLATSSLKEPPWLGASNLFRKNSISTSRHRHHHSTFNYRDFFQCVLWLDSCIKFEFCDKNMKKERKKEKMTSGTPHIAPPPFLQKPLHVRHDVRACALSLSSSRPLFFSTHNLPTYLSS